MSLLRLRATVLLFSNTLSVQPLRRHHISPVNPNHLLRVCTILYQQQNSPESRLSSKLTSCNFQLTHEFFLQVCNNFPYSWRPVYRFYLYTQQANPTFNHTPVSLNKMLDVIGKSRNIDLFWNLLEDLARRRFANDKTFIIALKTLGGARELKKCVEFFHLMNSNGREYNLGTLNKVVEAMCGCKLVEEAKFVVFKLKEVLKPDEVTYKHLIRGYCDKGDLIEASKVWNLMVDEGFKPDVDAVDKMIETLFKVNQYGEALKLFETMRFKRMDELDLSTYRLVIKWMCKKGMMSQAQEVFKEMRERGIQIDNMTLASVVCGLLVRRRVREAYRIVEGIEVPDLSLYHGLIKGLLKLRRAGEATQVFREMIRRGCEPTMHTYVMLLQGHLGRRGRKGPDPLVNFDTIFVGGMVKAGKSKEAAKYVERVMNRAMEVPSKRIQFTLSILLLGVGIATVTDLQLNALGSFLSFLAVITTCVAQIMTNTIQKKYKVSSTQLLYQSCPYQAATLLISGPYLDKLLTNLNVFAFKYTTQVTVFIILSCLISISVNFSTFLVIGKTSPVTYQVLGHLKTCLVLAFGYILLQDPFSWRNILGILIAMIGMILYSYYCTLENQQKTVEAAAQSSQAREGESDPLMNVENGGAVVGDKVVQMSPVWSKNKD